MPFEDSAIASHNAGSLTISDRSIESCWQKLGKYRFYPGGRLVSHNILNRKKSAGSFIPRTDSYASFQRGSAYTWA